MPSTDGPTYEGCGCSLRTGHVCEQSPRPRRIHQIAVLLPSTTIDHRRQLFHDWCMRMSATEVRHVTMTAEGTLGSLLWVARCFWLDDRRDLHCYRMRGYEFHEIVIAAPQVPSALIDQATCSCRLY